MAERIAEEKINQISQSVDIVEVISDYVQLKKQGRNYFGLCPFHGENSPLFPYQSINKFSIVLVVALVVMFFLF